MFEQAWSEAFAFTPAQLQHALASYFHGRAYAVYTAPVAEPQVETKISVLHDADVYALRALLFRNCRRCGSDWRTKAEENVALALRTDPDHLQALAVRYSLTDDKAERLALSRAATGAHPDEWLAWLMQVDSEEDQGVGKGADQADVTPSVRRLLELAPLQPYALMFAARQAASAGRTSDALQMSARALAQRPLDLELLAMRASIFFEAGDCAGAIAIVQRVAALLHERLAPRDQATIDKLPALCETRRREKAQLPAVPPPAPAL
jgi:tetratricopeptide (TPR) repeat protein